MAAKLEHAMHESAVKIELASHKEHTMIVKTATVQEIELNDRMFGLKTNWRYCQICTTIWAFDYMSDDNPVAHITLAEFDGSKQDVGSELCPDCEANIMKKGFEVHHGIKR